MTLNQHPARSYGGWRRRRSIGLWGLGPAGTFALLGCSPSCCSSPRARDALLYIGPPACSRRGQRGPGRREPVAARGAPGSAGSSPPARLHQIPGRVWSPS